MQPRIKIGLIVGIIGLVLNIYVVEAFCTSRAIVLLLVGGAAGFLAARREKPAVKSEGARAGVIAGMIAGGLALLGQIIGEINVLAFVQPGQVFRDPPIQPFFYSDEISTALGFAMIGILLVAGAGALAGYLGTPQQPAQPSRRI